MAYKSHGFPLMLFIISVSLLVGGMVCFNSGLTMAGYIFTAVSAVVFLGVVVKIYRHRQGR